MGALMILYPPPQYEPAQVKAWYRHLKQHSACPCCQVMQPTKTAIEYHHLDRSTKCDTLSNLVHFNAPLSVIMVETLKVTPLCSSHHSRYHQLERYGHTDLIKNLYDFANDRHYKQAIDEFHTFAWDTAPELMKTAYIDYMENGFEICDRPIKQFATPTISYRALR
jgi:hypothetical protein